MVRLFGSTLKYLRLKVSLRSPCPLRLREVSFRAAVQMPCLGVLAVQFSFLGVIFFHIGLTQISPTQGMSPPCPYEKNRCELRKFCHSDSVVQFLCLFLAANIF
jgi:hypothetical protein